MIEGAMRKDGRDISKYYEKYYGNGENTEREGTGKEMKMKKKKKKRRERRTTRAVCGIRKGINCSISWETSTHLANRP